MGGLYSRYQSPKPPPVQPSEHIIVKGILLGGTGSGKSALHRRISTDEFEQTPNAWSGTIEFCVQKYYADNFHVKLQLWDVIRTKWRKHSPGYYRGCSIAVFCFSLTDRASFEALQNELLDFTINETAPRPVVACLVGCKQDLIEDGTAQCVVRKEMLKQTPFLVVVDEKFLNSFLT
eukprot:TRINITY_DN1695_c0_g1_i3.p1 TRINITY_DN1695_c0_g1~~TRINITY_DN1695_c0_g1_i3.p1  ORF type:complete len:177 (+),score=23.76 TRINITY_DN1695_c0_g1_i3:20-550(+)